MKTLIVIPAFNEQESIGGIIADLRSNGYRNVIVIDDGSSDKTARQARKSRVPVIRHITNRGLGAALGTGFDYARENGFDVVVTFDADGQHQASDIKRLIAPLRQAKTDVVIGSRLQGRGKNMPLDRRIVNYMSNLLTYLLYGVRTTDSQSGLRAFSKKAIACITIKTERMEVSSEFFREIRRNKLEFVEIPIKAVYTEYSQTGSSQEKWSTIKLPLRLFLRLFR